MEERGREREREGERGKERERERKREKEREKRKNVIILTCMIYLNRYVKMSFPMIHDFLILHLRFVVSDQISVLAR